MCQPIGSSNGMVPFHCRVTYVLHNSKCLAIYYNGGEASIGDLICQLLVEMAKDMEWITISFPHSSLEPWGVHSCSGT
ncbi:Uncharacterized protein APZ42_008031 [Daphnia magna]|uniref:Uncharacterized protein n=1 Tax=Daphnia magna TaxID=35525 RepID=A0A162BTF4_9CRUS|nr:Uncharacterized protein APZ42_008031 [Daphnia magna]